MSDITREEIFTLKSEREEIFGPMWTAMDKDWSCIAASADWRKNIIPDYLTGFPNDYYKHMKVPPIAKKGLELFRNSVMSGEVPSAKVPLPKGMKPTTEKVEKLKKMQDYAEAWMFNAATKPSINPFVDILNKSGGLGMGGLSAPFDWEKWPKEPEEKTKEAIEQYQRDKESGWPWNVTVIPPRRIMPDPFNDPPEDVIIADKIGVRVAKKQYPKLNLTADDTGKIDRVVYVSKTEYAVFIGGQSAFESDVVENPMGELWVETVWSGIGELNAENEFEYLGQGIIRNAIDTIAMVVKAINRAEIVADDAAFTPLVVRGQTTAQAEEAAGRVEYGPDKVVAVENDIKFELMPKTPLSDQAVWTYEQMKMWLEICFGPTILSGASTTDTATTLMKNISLAEAPFRPIRVNAEQAAANILKMVFRFIKNELGEDSYLGTMDGGMVSISPDDIIDNCPITVNYRPPTDEERAFNAARDGDLLDRGMISPEEYKRRQGIEDSPEEEKDIIKGRIRNHPMLIDAMAQVIAAQIAPQPMMPETAPAQPAQPAPQTDQRMVTSNQQVAANQAQKMTEVPVGTR